jgi:hypothetical protein
MKKIYLIVISLFIFQTTIGQECLDLKFKLRGYFYAKSSLIDSTALGGFYHNQNSPNTVTKELNNISQAAKFQIIVKTDSIANYSKEIKGFKVFIVNKTDSIISLFAQDSRLAVKRQVFYNGKWSDIEYLPRSWCGNSYHSIYLKPDEFWHFNAPCLTGNIEAKFRFELHIRGNLTIYSNEFSGSFNEEQLEKKQGHKATNIMDPYND